MFCQNCGTQIDDNAKFCDSCGTQTVSEQKNIIKQQAQNANAHTDKSISGSVCITVAMAVFSLFFILFVGFEEDESMLVTVTAIVFAVFMTGLKWFFEIKAQKRYKKEAEEKAKGSDGHVL